MMNATQTQSLIEKYTNATAKKMPYGVIYPERQEMEWELKTLLEYEANNILHDYEYGEERAFELLSEYRETFAWRECYSVEVEWNLYIESIPTEKYCKSKEEALAYLSGDLRCEPLDLCDADPEYDYTGEHSTPEIKVLVLDFELQSESVFHKLLERVNEIEREYNAHISTI